MDKFMEEAIATYHQFVSWETETALLAGMTAILVVEGSYLLLWLLR